MTGPERCLKTQNANGKLVCADKSKSSLYGHYLLRSFLNFQTWCRFDAVGGTPTPWIFDVAKKAGYVTLFAEEFCFDRSEYVAQNNLFNLTADILPHRMFCRQAEAKAIQRGRKITGAVWKFEDNFFANTCIGGSGTFPKVHVALDHVKGMWSAYPDTPKLAYVNAMSAHHYTGYFRYALKQSTCSPSAYRKYPV